MQSKWICTTGEIFYMAPITDAKMALTLTRIQTRALSLSQSPTKDHNSSSLGHSLVEAAHLLFFAIWHMYHPEALFYCCKLSHNVTNLCFISMSLCQCSPRPTPRRLRKNAQTSNEPLVYNASLALFVLFHKYFFGTSPRGFIDVALACRSVYMKQYWRKSKNE